MLTGTSQQKDKEPWKIIFSKSFSSRAEAVQLEIKLKGFKNPRKVRYWIVKETG